MMALAQSPATHWAYQPIDSHAADVPSPGWIDAQLDAAARAHGVEPAGSADPATLCRRLYLVLTGLPPTTEQVARFMSLPGATRVEFTTDALLASPAFGEHWGRHWLDVVRYADSVTLRGFVFREAWRYRDYVVDAFNADEPFADFVREQVAGDLLPAPAVEDARRNRVAATFWALGDSNLEEQDKRQLELDVIDEQLEVMGKAFLAQTLSCARCHDHKFDPIPTQDYHALAGILSGTRLLRHANVSEWIETPLPLEPAEEARWKAAEERLARLEAELKSLKSLAESAVATATLPALGGIVVDDDAARLVGDWTPSTANRPFVGKGYRHDGNEGKGRKTATFHPTIPRAGEYEVRVAHVPGGNRAARVPVTVFSADGERVFHVDQRQRPSVGGRFVSLGRARFEKDGAGFVMVSNDGTDGHVILDAVQFIPVPPADGGTLSVEATAGPEPRQPATSAPDLGRVRVLEKAVAEARVAARRPHVMAPVESGATNLPVLRRGSWRNPGEVVPRGVLRAAFRATAPEPSGASSGRAELAGWLVAHDQPLSWRVHVNRAWHWTFGRGLVASVDNLGTTGDPPTHPALLEALAAGFRNGGGSTKRLVRALVLTRAFQRASSMTDALVARSRSTDPVNRWLGRFQSRPAEAEVLRDSMLLAGDGLLHGGRGEAPFPPGIAADYGHALERPVRSLRLPQFRNARPEFLMAFDGADPCRVMGAREASTVAPQALFVLNHGMVREQAARAAACVDPADDAIGALWVRILGREPSGGERRAAEEHLAGGGSRTESMAELAHALFASLDFRRIP